LEPKVTKPETTKKLLTLPNDMFDWVTRKAERNLSTANSEIVRAVRMRMEQERERAD
jgi:hypothetical protein